MPAIALDRALDADDAGDRVPLTRSGRFPPDTYHGRGDGTPDCGFEAG